MKRLIVLLLAGLLAGMSVEKACAQACAVTLTPPAHESTPEGGPFTVTVGTGATCQWTAVTSEPWISLTNYISEGGLGYGYYIGPGSVDLIVDRNGNCDPRTGTVVFADAVFALSQQASEWSIDPTSYSVPLTGGTAQVSVDAASNCLWYVMPQVAWIGVEGDTEGGYFGYSPGYGYGYLGGGVVMFPASANDDCMARTGTVVFMDEVFTLDQPATPWSKDSSSYVAPVNGGTAVVTVVSGLDCVWYVRPDIDWVTLAGDTAGGYAGYSASFGYGYRGGGQVTLSVMKNATRRTRNGTILFEDEVFSLEQDRRPASLPYFMMMEERE